VCIDGQCFVTAPDAIVSVSSDGMINCLGNAIATIEDMLREDAHQCCVTLDLSKSFILLLGIERYTTKSSSCI
jgi:hypothetical protein